MKILDETLRIILVNVPKVPPETGGILGGRNQIISHCVFDSGSSASNGYDIYAPDINLLNQAIDQWAKKGIEFYGMFHSHFPYGTALSDGDVRYISKIMLATSPQIHRLYFPIVFPQERMIVYRADRYGDTVHIVSDQIELL